MCQIARFLPTKIQLFISLLEYSVVSSLILLLSFISLNFLSSDVSFSLKNDDAPVAIFSGEHLIFPIIIEIPKKDHFMVNGLFISLVISGKKYGQQSRVPHFSKLIFNYLKVNQLIEIDNLGNIEIRQEIYP